MACHRKHALAELHILACSVSSDINHNYLRYGTWAILSKGVAGNPSNVVEEMAKNTPVPTGTGVKGETS